MSVSKIKATLPKGGHANGLDSIAPDMARDPHRKRLVIMLVDCGRVQLDHAEDGDIEDTQPGITATARIRRIEPVAPGDEDTARALLLRGRDHRLGKPALDLSTEQEIRGLFDKGE